VLHSKLAPNLRDGVRLHCRHPRLGGHRSEGSNAQKTLVLRVALAKESVETGGTPAAGAALRLRSSQMMALSRFHSRSCGVLVRLQKGEHNLAIEVCRLRPETTLFRSYWRRHEPRGGSPTPAGASAAVTMIRRSAPEISREEARAYTSSFSFFCSNPIQHDLLDGLYIMGACLALNMLRNYNISTCGRERCVDKFASGSAFSSLTHLQFIFGV
jgi:hypothetical protein